MPDLPVDPSALADFGTTLAVLGAVVLAVVRGWLVPGRQVDRLLAVKDQVIADKSEQVTDWRQAYRAEATRGDVLAAGQQQVISMLRQLSATGGER